MHRTIEPAILYFGTPVALISTLNQDGSVNLAPNSSVWWLAWSCMLGLDASSQTAENLLRTGECVLNLPSADKVEQIDKIARTTGRKEVPLHKRALGYRYEKNKLGQAGFTVSDSFACGTPRVNECPVQLEARLVKVSQLGEASEKMAVPILAIELEIIKVHVDENLLIDSAKHRVDPDKWQPLIMCFRKYYTTGNYIHPSRLAHGPEDRYALWKSNRITRGIMQWLLRRDTDKFKRRSAS